jgi:hypothetical protein
MDRDDALARRQQLQTVQMIVRLLRQAMVRAKTPGPWGVTVFRPFSGGHQLVTNDHVDAIRDQDGI